MREYLEAADDDILADAEAQCDWLREVGFEDVDVFFQMPEMAIFGGVKGGEVMEAVRTIEGRIQVLDRSDVDTDQIIPKQYLKRIERTGFGEFLFADWRKEGLELDPNRPILVTERNFGCGSSREHAVWALQDFGFRAVIAPSFADIFYGNCTKTGLLPVVLPPETVRELMNAERATVDLERQVVEWEGGSASFDINPDTRRRLLEGLDEIALTLREPGRHRPLRGPGRRRRARSPHRCRLRDMQQPPPPPHQPPPGDLPPTQATRPLGTAVEREVVPAEREVVLDPLLAEKIDSASFWSKFGSAIAVLAAIIGVIAHRAGAGRPQRRQRRLERRPAPATSPSCAATSNCLERQPRHCHRGSQDASQLSSRVSTLERPGNADLRRPAAGRRRTSRRAAGPTRS